MNAIDEGIVTTNPVARTGRLTRSREDRASRIAPLTAGEVRTLLSNANRCLYAFLLCAVRTGMRQGEIIGLRWGDVDFKGAFIEVRQAVVRRRITSPKTTQFAV